jgi:hypothetical protein
VVSVTPIVLHIAEQFLGERDDIILFERSSSPHRAG